MGRKFLFMAVVMMIFAGCGGIDWFPATDPNTAGSVDLSTDQSSPIAGSTVTITAKVKKQDKSTAVGNGTPVDFSSTGGTFVPSSGSVTTDATGTATVTFTSTTAGPFVVTARAGTAETTVTVTFQSTVSVTVDHPNIRLTDLSATTPVKVTATVTDSSGTPKPNVTVAFTVSNPSGGVGTLNATSAVTVSDGTATVNLTNATAAGTYTITATTPDGNFGTTTVNVTVL